MVKALLPVTYDINIRSKSIIKARSFHLSWTQIVKTRLSHFFAASFAAVFIINLRVNRTISCSLPASPVTDINYYKEMPKHVRQFGRRSIHAKPGRRENLFSRVLIDAALMLPNVLARYGVAGLFGIAHAILQLIMFLFTRLWHAIDSFGYPMASLLMASSRLHSTC